MLILQVAQNQVQTALSGHRRTPRGNCFLPRLHSTKVQGSELFDAHPQTIRIARLLGCSHARAAKARSGILRHSCPACTGVSAIKAPCATQGRVLIRRFRPRRETDRRHRAPRDDRCIGNCLICMDAYRLRIRFQTVEEVSPAHATVLSIRLSLQST